MAVSNEIHEFVISYGLSKTTVRGDEIWALCPFHDDKHPNNFSINLVSGKYHCFACLASGSILHYGYTLGLGFNRVSRLWSNVQKSPEREIYLPSKPLDKSIVEFYKQFGVSKYAESRISRPILSEYNVYADKDDNPIFFIVDFDGNYRAVWVRDEKLIPKYFLIDPPTAKRDGYLFGQHIKNADFTVLTEGFFDAMAFRERLSQRGVCMNGLYLSKAQVKTLEKLQPIYLFTDGDKRGRMARNAIYQKIKHLDVRICGGYNGDSDEMDDKCLNQIINSAMTKIEWELYVQRYNT